MAANDARRGGRKVLEFDSRSFSFGAVRRNAGKWVRRILGYLLTTVFAALLAYAVFAVFFRTDTERMLRREIRMYERLYPELQPRAEMIRDAVAGLQHKDNEIYEQVFHTDAPDLDPTGHLSFLFASDTIPDEQLTAYTRDKADSLMGRMADVEAAFGRIFAALSTAPSCARP